MTTTGRDPALASAMGGSAQQPVPVPVEPMTWDEWLAFDPGDDTRYELVEGVPTMSPGES